MKGRIEIDGHTYCLSTEWELPKKSTEYLAEKIQTLGTNPAITTKDHLAKRSEEGWECITCQLINNELSIWFVFKKLAS